MVSWWFQNNRAPDLQKPKSVVMNKTWRVEVRNCPWAAAIEWFLKMKLFSVQSMIHSDIYIVYVWPLTSWMLSSTWLCFALILGLNLVGKQWQTCPQYCKNNGTWDHQNCILIGSRSWWGFEWSIFFYFNCSMTRDQWIFVSLLLWVIWPSIGMSWHDSMDPVSECSVFLTWFIWRSIRAFFCDSSTAAHYWIMDGYLCPKKSNGRWNEEGDNQGEDVAESSLQNHRSWTWNGIEWSGME